MSKETFLDEQYDNYCNNLKEAQSLLAKELAGIYSSKKAHGLEISKAFIEVNTLFGSKIKTIDVYGIGPNGKCAVDKDGNFYASDWASSNGAKMNVSPKMRDILIHKGDGVGYILRGRREARDVAEALIGCKMHRDRFIKWIPDVDEYHKSVHLGREIMVKDSTSIKNIYYHETEGSYCYGYDVFDANMDGFEEDNHDLIRTGKIREVVDYIIRINMGEEDGAKEYI